MKIVLSSLPKEGSAINWVTAKYFKPDNSRYMPLGLLSLATNIPQDYDIKILDPHSRNWSIDKTVEEIEKEKPDILGLSVVTYKAYQMKEILQKTTASYKIVGGPHTIHAAEIILNQGADAIFRGQLAELEFAQAIKTKPKGIIDCHTKIEQTEFPKRHNFIEDLNFYSPPQVLFKGGNRMGFYSGVGCPHRCRFCDVYTKKTERRKPEIVLDEMIYLQSLGAPSLHVYEDNFNTDENYLKEICKEMDKRGFNIEWSGRGQVKMSLELAQMLSDRGFKRIHAGIESFSDKTLRYFRKPQNFKQIKKFCDTMKETSIDIIGFLIIGAPTDTKEDRKNISPLVKELGIKYPMFNIYQPLPHTEYYNDLLEQRIYKKDYWGDYIKNPIKDFMIPFPYGEKKWEEDAAFVEELIQEFYKNE